MATVDLEEKANDELTPYNRKTIAFPEGVPAFEAAKEFVLIWNEEEAPFLWLQSLDMPDLAFVVIDPFLVSEGYLPDVPDEDIAALEIKDEKDVFILSIVNIKNNEKLEITANLLSPIVINWKKQLGKQVILNNHHLYSLATPVTL